MEELKKANLTGKSAAAIFFDISDAFGSVDRKQLLWKLGNYFEISGKLFLHLHAFLSSRKARIVLNGECGEWVWESGTSAGTILGSILFIIYIHDAPKVAKKFADDVSGIAVANNVARYSKYYRQRHGL